MGWKACLFIIILYYYYYYYWYYYYYYHYYYYYCYAGPYSTIPWKALCPAPGVA